MRSYRCPELFGHLPQSAGSLRVCQLSHPSSDLHPTQKRFGPFMPMKSLSVLFAGKSESASSTGSDSAVQAFINN